MKISVWDTYITRKDGEIMHFDILAPTEVTNANTIFEYGNSYLQSKPFTTGTLTSKECNFCHIQEASKVIVEDIKKKGYHIIEIENCT